MTEEDNATSALAALNLKEKKNSGAPQKIRNTRRKTITHSKHLWNIFTVRKKDTMLEIVAKRREKSR